MKYRPRPAAAAALLALLAAAPASGQRADNAPRPLPPPSPPSPSATAAIPEKRFDIEIEGGIPAQEAVALIAKKLDHPINVIFTGDSADTPLPTLRLHQVTLPEFFAAVAAAGRLEQGSGRPGYGFAPVDGASNIYTFAVNIPADTPPTMHYNVGIGGAQAIGGGGAVPVAKTSLFFDLSTILDDTLTIEDIITAVRTAWTAADGTEPPAETLKFHKETKLLIATGTPERLGIIDSIVKLLEARKRPSKDQQQKEIQSLTANLRDSEERASRLAKKLEQAEAEKEDIYRNSRDRISELESERSRLKNEEANIAQASKESKQRIAELEIELAKREKKP